MTAPARCSISDPVRRSSSRVSSASRPRAARSCGSPAVPAAESAERDSPHRGTQPLSYETGAGAANHPSRPPQTSSAAAARSTRTAATRIRRRRRSTPRSADDPEHPEGQIQRARGQDEARSATTATVLTPTARPPPGGGARRSAPHPPRAGGASANPATPGASARRRWTIARWTPGRGRERCAPRRRRPGGPRSRYSLTTLDVSSGRKLWRSRTSASGRATASSMTPSPASTEPGSQHVGRNGIARTRFNEAARRRPGRSAFASGACLHPPRPAREAPRSRSRRCAAVRRPEGLRREAPPRRWTRVSRPRSRRRVRASPMPRSAPLTATTRPAGGLTSCTVLLYRPR